MGHVQKRMGTALRNLKAQSYLMGKLFGGKGQFTETLIESLQNYYGHAIKDSRPGMMKAVQKQEHYLLPWSHGKSWRGLVR